MPGLVTTLTALATMCSGTGCDADAERYLKRAAAAAGHHYGPRHEAHAVALANLAVYYRDRDQVARAEALSRRAVEAIETSSPAGPPGVSPILEPRPAIAAAILDTHASILARIRGRREEAKRIGLRADAIRALLP
jgi:hypothetical protein